MNLSSVPRDRWWGRLLRAPLGLIPDDLVVPVLQGPARGLRWIVGSAQHGCWLGSYEAEPTECFAALVSAGDVIYDLGAHVGWYTLVGARATGPGGRVVAFEPVLENVAFLRRHLELNDLANVTIVEAAVSDAGGESGFDAGKDRFQGRIVDGGESEMSVETVRLDDLLGTGEFPSPDVIKIDVEGAEAAVLRGASSVLASARPTLLLATHGVETREECVRTLSDQGYRVDPVTGPTLEAADVLLARPREGASAGGR